MPCKSLRAARSAAAPFAVFAAAFLAAAFLALPAAAQTTHQWVRVNNATGSAVKLSYYSPGGQKWEDLAAGVYTDIDVARGPAGNFLVQVVSSGSANQANTQLTTPPANPTHEFVIFKNATLANVSFSYYSPGGQQWRTLSPSFFETFDVARGPAGYLLVQIVP